ncbi:hypothetical protein ZEAMMB73_Zm00001d051409 [Zea mays]|uniref:Uncharacterized protein n=1 Tax=Zea mays TaxID=4577 RepID=A0A1D6Q6R6_MAIZE|nr:hypothetical protein ZEAMMB73_Zm00001d051409 [Zea mays]
MYILLFLLRIIACANSVSALALQRGLYIVTFKYKDFPLATGSEVPMSRNNSEEAEIKKRIESFGRATNYWLGCLVLVKLIEMQRTLT